MAPSEHQQLTLAFARIAEWLGQAADMEPPVNQVRPAAELRADMDLGLSAEGGAVLSDDVAAYLGAAVRTGSPTFANQLFSGVNVPGVVGEALIAATNTTMATYEAAPVATVIEQEVLQHMGKLAGFEACEGTFVSGGSNGNHVAMLAARAKETRVGRNVAFVSIDAHYSFEMSTHVMGMTPDQLVRVPTDAGGHMDTEALREAMKTCEGVPFFVGCTAGTTVQGAFDPIDEIVDIAKEYGAWVHVDGAWGGAALLSKRFKKLTKGVERADSLAWDAHKLMGIPLICSAILTRERGYLAQTHGPIHAEYLYHGEDQDLGRLSLACGRRADALKLWLAWRVRGDDGFCARIERLGELADQATALIESNPRLEFVGGSPTFLNLCFRVRPGDGAYEDSHQLEARELLKSSGRSLVNHAEVNGHRIFRLVLANHAATEASITKLFEDVLWASDSAGNLSGTE